MSGPSGGDRILPSFIDIFTQEFLSEGCLCLTAGNHDMLGIHIQRGALLCEGALG